MALAASRRAAVAQVVVPASFCAKAVSEAGPATLKVSLTLAPRFATLKRLNKALAPLRPVPFGSALVAGRPRAVGAAVARPAPMAAKPAVPVSDRPTKLVRPQAASFLLPRSMPNCLTAFDLRQTFGYKSLPEKPPNLFTFGLYK